MSKPWVNETVFAAAMILAGLMMPAHFWLISAIAMVPLPIDLVTYRCRRRLYEQKRLCLLCETLDGHRHDCLYSEIERLHRHLRN